MFKKILTFSLLALISIGGILIQSTTGVYAISEAEFNAADAAQLKQQGISDAQISQIQSQEKSTGNSQDAKMKEMLNNLVAGINIILNILTIIVTPAIMLASWLMSPDWTAGDIFGIRPVLHDLWITVSNITYLVYAVLLIFIAVATIFNSEHYGYKSMLPKLALGIILVPLTWWGVQFTISVATYATAAAVSVPAESLKKYTDSSAWWNTPVIPVNMEYKNGKFYSGENDLSKDGAVTELCKTAGKCATPEKVTTDAGGLFSPLLIYSFGVFKIQNVQKIDTKMDVVTSIMHIIHQGIIGALMFIIYGLLVMALIFMLIMRAMKLWFYAIFSPLFTIKYMLGDKGFGEADKDGSFKITEFIGLAFVPAVVSLALSFGLIIVSALYTPLGNKGVENPNNKCESSGECTIIIANNPKNTIVSKTIETKQGNKSSTTVTIGGIGYTFEGAVEGGEKVVPGVKSALSATGNLFGTIIIDIIALVFIWLAFMAGKGVSKAAGNAIKPFEDMGKKIGDLGMSLPKYTPLPVPGGSIAGMQKTVDLSQNALHESSNKRFEESAAGKFFGANKYIPEDTDKKIVQDLKNISRTSIDDIRQKGSAGVFAKENAYMSESIKELANLLKDPTKREQFLKEATHLNDEQRRQFRDFQDKPDNDENRKKLAALMNSTFGTAASTGATTNVIGAATRDAGGNGNNVMITLGGAPITIQNKKSENTAVITKENLKALEGKSKIMTEDELLTALTKDDTMTKDAAKQIIKEIKDKNPQFFK